jgi:hypothetical protein
VGDWGWCGEVFGGHRGFWAGKEADRGKHRTEVTEVAEGDRWGLGLGRGRFLWTTGLLGEKRAVGEEHRTEVTEVTEGTGRWWGLGLGRFLWTTGLLGEKRADRGEHRTEVTEVTEGIGRWWGLGLVAEAFLVDKGDSGRGTGESGRASNRGNRGGLGLVGEFLVNTGLLGEKYASFA